MGESTKSLAGALGRGWCHQSSPSFHISFISFKKFVTKLHIYHYDDQLHILKSPDSPFSFLFCHDAINPIGKRPLSVHPIWVGFFNGCCSQFFIDVFTLESMAPTSACLCCLPFLNWHPSSSSYKFQIFDSLLLIYFHVPTSHSNH